MPVPLKVGLPPELDLDAGYVIRFSAIDPTTGAAVAGVVVNNPSLFVRNLTGGGDSGLETGPWRLVPGGAAAV